MGLGEGTLGAYQIRGTDDSKLSVATVSLTNLAELGDQLRGLVFNKLEDSHQQTAGPRGDRPTGQLQIGSASDLDGHRVPSTSP
jgi:hypothetical protein